MEISVHMNPYLYTQCIQVGRLYLTQMLVDIEEDGHLKCLLRWFRTASQLRHNPYRPSPPWPISADKDHTHDLVVLTERERWMNCTMSRLHYQSWTRREIRWPRLTYSSSLSLPANIIFRSIGFERHLPPSLPPHPAPSINVSAHRPWLFSCFVFLS